MFSMDSNLELIYGYKIDCPVVIATVVMLYICIYIIAQGVSATTPSLMAPCITVSVLQMPQIRPLQV